METDAAEAYCWQATFRNWSVTSRFIPLPILKRRLLARWPNLDPAPVLRNIETRMQGLQAQHRTH